jgi:hypothetical protein
VAGAERGRGDPEEMISPGAPLAGLTRAAALCAVAVLGACTHGGGGESGPDLPACQAGPLLTVPPIPAAALSGIVPLGNLLPGAHTFPTDHLYVYVATGGGPRPVYPLLAPGRGWITAVGSTQKTGQPAPDYQLTFAPCAEVELTFAHVVSLAPSLASALSSESCSRYDTGGLTVTQCWANVAVAVSAGDTLGSASGFDLGAYDSRDTGPVANPARYPSYDHRRHTVCPLDYFDPSDAASYAAHLGAFDGSVQRTIAPLCGTIFQDAAGTAQGVWYKPGAPPIPEDPHLALVHDNVNPTLGVFSSGTSVAGIVDRTYPFTPTSSGLVNRDFDQVTADGNLYCYDGFPTGGGPGLGIVLLSMPDATTLRIEHQDGGTSGDCGNGGQPRAFAAPTTFVR